MKFGRRRLAAGCAVLLGLAVVASLLIPPYVDSWKLQQYLNALVEDDQERAKAPDALQEEILNHAASLGIPVRPGDVQVLKTGDDLRIRVLYVVHVEMFVYSADLHFRPKAGSM